MRDAGFGSDVRVVGRMGQGLRELELQHFGVFADGRARVSAKLRRAVRAVRRLGARALPQSPTALPVPRHGSASLPPRYRIVEMIGPSCVGKSTLHRNAIRVLDCAWQTTPPAWQDSTGSVTADADTMETLIQWRLGRALSANSWSEKRLEGLRTDLATIQQDLAVRRAAATGQVCFLLDEGLFKRFVATRKFANVDDALLRRWLEGRAIVHLSIRDRQEALRRIAGRARGGNRLGGYDSCASVDEIIAKLDAKIALNEAQAARFAELGAPVLSLFADDPIAQNVEALRAFEAELLTLK